MEYYIAVVAALVAIGIVWIRWHIKLRAISAKAEFYEGLYRVMEMIRLSSYPFYAPSPCVNLGMTYIKSVPKRERHRVEEEVYNLLDQNYCTYLNWLLMEIERRGDVSQEADVGLQIIFEQNHQWLSFDEAACEWYGAAKYKKSKDPSCAKAVLLEKRAACYQRVAEAKAAEEERLRRLENEQRQAVIAEQERKGFWRCMAEIN